MAGKSSKARGKSNAKTAIKPVPRKSAKPRNAGGGNPENPSVPLDPDYWEEIGWLGSRSDAGVRVTPRTALGHPPILRAINLISRGVSKLPRAVHILDKNGDDAGIDREHSAHKLIGQGVISHKPNGSMRSKTWLEVMLFHALFRGNGYSAIFRRGPDPSSIVLLDPTKTESFWVGDQLWYKTEAGGQKRKIPADDMLHFKGLSWDGIEGIDVLSYMANAFALGPAARKWLSKLLSRGSTAGGLLQLPRELSPDARKKRQEEFDKYQSGLDNAFKTLALEDGAKWIRTMITPQEAMIFQILGFDAKSVSNVFGVSAHKLGDDTRNSYNSLEQENKSYLEDSLDPWCVEVETECNDKLLTEEEKANETRALKIDRSEFEIGDRNSETTAATTAVNGGLLSPDEGRDRIGYPPLPNGEGKKIRIPVNVAVDGKIAGRIAGVTPEPDPAAAPVPAPAGAPTDPAMKNAARDLVLDRLKRLDKIAADQLPKATNKSPEAVADFWRNHRERIRDALAPVLPVVALANGRTEPGHSADEIAAVLQGTVDEQLGEVLRLAVTAKD